MKAVFNGDTRERKYYQSAVEWFVEMLVQECGLDNEGDMAKLIINQAKEMEKEQITSAYRVGKAERTMPTEKLTTGEQYYNETFKSE